MEKLAKPKQVRTNMGLANTVIPSSFIYFIYLRYRRYRRRYRTLCTNQDNFCLSCLELVYKPKYEIWRESDDPSAQDPVYRLDLYGRYRTLLTNQANFWQLYLGGTRYCFPFSIPTSISIIQACVQNCKSIAL